MKKFIASIITVMLLVSCFGLTAFAAGTPITISDDYQTLQYKGNTFTRVDASMLDADYDLVIADSVELSSTQQENVKDVFLQLSEQEIMIYAEISFRDGSTLTVEFLQDDYLAAYNEVVKGQPDTYIIDFEWPEGNTVNATHTKLFGNKVNLTSSYLQWCDYYYVNAQSSDSALAVVKGYLLINDGKYYYADFAENNLSADSFDLYDLSQIAVHEITDEDLLKNIQTAEDKYYSDDLGFLYNDDLTETISAVFLIFFFAVVPFILLVLFLILAIRSKTVYKKLFRLICILSGAELIIFSIITVFVMMNR